MGPVTDGRQTWTGLAGLEWVGDQLLAVHRDTSALLRIDPATGVAMAVSTIAGYGRVESLAADPLRRTLHAFDNETRTHLGLALDAGYAPTVLSQGQFGRSWPLPGSPSASA